MIFRSKVITAVLGLFLILGCDEAETTIEISGRVIRNYQVNASFVTQAQVAGAHIVVGAGTNRYDIAGEPVSIAIIGDSVKVLVVYRNICMNCNKILLARNITIVK